MVGIATLALQSHAHVFHHTHVAEHGGYLERAHQAQARNLVGLEAGDGLAQVEDLAAGRREKLGEQIKHGGFTGPVGTDQGVDVALLHTQINRVYGGKTAKLLGQAACFQDKLW